MDNSIILIDVMDFSIIITPINNRGSYADDHFHEPDSSGQLQASHAAVTLHQRVPR